jgi:ABC-type multidrug transport system fused ATPase/permease subunit
VSVNKAVACGDRVADVLDMKNDIEQCYRQVSVENNYINNIEFDNVCLTYSKSKEESLSDLNFEINEGETIGIIGGTGSGKTSLINMIPRFYDATKGEVRINGMNVKDYDVASVRKNISIVPQKSVLFKGTIRDNMRFANENATDEEIIKALKLAQAYEFVSKKEGVLDYEIEQEGKNLSGGQRQRLAIARAMVADASVVIFDDSMSALDYATDAALRKELSNIKDKIKIIVSQRVASIGSADKIIVMDDGRISGIGTHDELLRDNEVYREIYESQTQSV